MSLQAIYTEKSNCKDCYRCVRECPVKAIQVKDNSASIIHEQCIYCGHCTTVCSVGAKKIRNELTITKELLASKRVILALAPSYKAQFAAYSSTKLETLFKKCGFYAISETALGADIINQATIDWLNDGKSGTYYSSSCPVCVELISKYYPKLVNRLTPVVSPFIAHAKLLRKEFDESYKLVFVSPCPAKKMENDRYNRPYDAVLTFNELHLLIKESPNVIIQDFSTPYFVPYKAKEGVFYPVEGGMLRGMELLKDPNRDSKFKYISVTSISNLKKIFELPQPDKENLFVEIMACQGGCINGPVFFDEESEILKKMVINNAMLERVTKDSLDKSQESQSKIDNSAIDPELVWLEPEVNNEADNKFNYSHQELTESLKSIGKNYPQDELNCKGCGYDSCRELAIALLSGKAERSMCISYMRNVASDKASVLLQKMPYGVAIVNDKLEIVECNRRFAELFGDDCKKLFISSPGLTGADLTKIAPFHPIFKQALETGEVGKGRDLHLNGRYLNVSIFTIQPHKLVCGIVRDLNLPDVQKEEILFKSRQVIKQTLSTVQKVAYLLGENASSTEILLNSTIKLYSDLDTNDVEQY